MSTPRLYGCCRGLDRGAYAIKAREGYFNFHRPDSGEDDFYFNAYDPALHWKYATFLTLDRERTVVGFAPGFEPTDSDGEWTQTKNRYDGSLGGDTLPAMPPTSSPYSFTWIQQSETISTDGLVRTTVWEADYDAGTTITQVDTLSNEYTDSQIAFDLCSALLGGFNWATLAANHAALVYFNGPLSTNKARDDYEIGFDWPFGPVDRAFLDLGNFPSAMTIRDDVANVYSIRQNQYVDPLTNGGTVGWEDDPSGDIACTNYASSNCRLHELEILRPILADFPTDTFILKKILQKNQLCS